MRTPEQKQKWLEDLTRESERRKVDGDTLKFIDEYPTQVVGTLESPAAQKFFAYIQDSVNTLKTEMALEMDAEIIRVYQGQIQALNAVLMTRILWLNVARKAGN